MNDPEQVEEIARGYAVCALFTADIDGEPGEYIPDEAKVEAIMPQAREAAAAFAHIVGRRWPGIDNERIGNCLHYDREGHGCGFSDEEGSEYLLNRCKKVARMMGEDYEMQEELMERFGAFADR